MRNDDLSMTLGLGVESDPDKGIRLLAIRDETTGHPYLDEPISLFEFSVNNGRPVRSTDLVVTGVHETAPQTIAIVARAPGEGLTFSLTLSGATPDPVIICTLTLTSSRQADSFLRMVVPKIRTIQAPGTAADNTMGMVSMEIGSVVPLRPLYDDNTTEDPRTGETNEGTLGMPYRGEAKRIGLPRTMNTMEVASLYDPAGRGGIFFADLDGHVESGVAPIQFTISIYEVAGFWIANLRPGTETAVSRFAIGVHHAGDWHHAVDYYVRQHRQRWSFPEPPGWYKRQAAIYTHSGGGAGGIYLDRDKNDLAAQLGGSFTNLPRLLADAMQLGTRLVYLWDYWDGVPVNPLPPGGWPVPPPYWNKGDYVPRADLGGADALKSGIQKVHEKRGKVILYVEPFILWPGSDVARFRPDPAFETQGAYFAGRFPVTPPLDVIAHPREKNQIPQDTNPQYPDQFWKIYDADAVTRDMPGPYFTMVPALAAWQDHVLAVVRRLVHDYGADGIFLDSFGWQMNYPMRIKYVGPRGLYEKQYWPIEYTQGVLTLADRVRAEIGPDRIVLVETPSGPMGGHCHGGLSADFTTLHQSDGLSNQKRITASPVRYALPQIRYFSNGKDLNGLHQIYAAGHGLALCHNDLRLSTKPDEAADMAEHIKWLVRQREAYSDALILGRQTYQPATGSEEVAAYYYEGPTHEVITIVNTSAQATYSGSLQLSPLQRHTIWQELRERHGVLRFFGGGIPRLSAVGTDARLPVTVPPLGLRILLLDRFLTALWRRVQVALRFRPTP